MIVTDLLAEDQEKVLKVLILSYQHYVYSQNPKTF